MDMTDDLVKRLRFGALTYDDYMWKAADRIEALERERDDARAYAAEVRMREKRAEDARIAAEARLAKAVEALDRLARLGNEPHFGNSKGNVIARATLAEIGGEA